MVLIKTPDTIIDKSPSSIIKYWRENPVIAANHLLRRDGEPLELAPIQEIILTEWFNSQFSLLTASRGCGKTFLAGVFSALQCMLYPGTRIGIFAPAFRQSKLIFDEFKRLHDESPLLQQCIVKEPTKGNDQCICTFKSPGMGRLASELKALPVGSDGGKIRGARLKYAILDEIPHIPESIFRASIHPMMSTVANPMQKVKEIKKLKERLGDKYKDHIPPSSNGYIGITSGYYQFNYWWNEMLNFYDQIKRGDNKYNLRFVPYTELPEGFYDMNVVQDARANSPNHMFMTEWMAKWISDSDGTFAMSLLESVRDSRVIPKSSRDNNHDKGKEYLFGVDVARERDSTTIIVVELGYPSSIVYISELEEKPFPEQAKHLFNLIDRFNPIRIEMDSFGGGGTLRDYLADPESVGVASSNKVIQTSSPPSTTGKRILHLRAASPEFNETANNNTKTLLEQGAIKLPNATNPIEISRKVSSGRGSLVYKEVDLVQELINQTASITVTLLPSGRLHYDLPKSGANTLNVKKKDLYSAFVLACNSVYELQWKTRQPETGIVPQGVIREISTNYNNRLTNSPTHDKIGSSRQVGVQSTTGPSGDQRIVLPGGGVIFTRNDRKR